MLLRLGDMAPNFAAETTEGPIDFHDWMSGHWAVLFSHPKDFTPVCTTELGVLARLKGEFDRRGVKIIAISVDPVEKHRQWAKDIAAVQGQAPNFPMIGDSDLSISKLWGMLPPDAGSTSEGRSPADNQTVRNVFVLAPDNTIRLIMSYPMTTGRNFAEILRALDSLQLTARHKVATAANWRPGDDLIIAGSVSDEDARQTYPEGWRAPRPYIRIVPAAQLAG